MSPVILGRVSIAPNATIVGDVFLGENISIGHGTIIRGDINSVKYCVFLFRIHYRCAIGDNCVLHTAASSPSGLPS